MSKRTTITCFCHVEVEADEYEALTIVDQMLKRKFPIDADGKVTVTVYETITTGTDRCGIIYENKENG